MSTEYAPGRPVFGDWYLAATEGRLTAPADPGRRAQPVLELMHDQFRALVLSRAFPCVGAKSALGRGSYRVGLHGDLGSGAAVETLARSLRAFVEEFDAPAPDFNTLIAFFEGPAITSELEFERLLWRQLQHLHDTDARQHNWNRAVSDNPENPDFSFSFAGQAFFVVGLHPHSSRWARRFAWPMLVFNRHDQFERLRAEGRFARLRAAIRGRDRALQGHENPMIADFGSHSEARQYSGRAVEDDWVCPFHAGRSPEGSS